MVLDDGGELCFKDHKRDFHTDAFQVAIYYLHYRHSSYFHLVGFSPTSHY